MTDPYAPHIVRTFHEALDHLDASEVVIRDMIENELMDVAGVNRTKVSHAVTSGKDLATRIAGVRLQHIKRAFRHLRDHLPSDL